MKLIDADKLLALIDAKIQELGLSGSTWVGRSVLHDLRSEVTSLQQDKEALELEMCSEYWWEERGWIMIPPNATLKGIESLLEQVKKKLQQEQPEQPKLDLDVILKGFINRYAIENGGEYPSAIDIANRFYELGKNAKKEEQLWTGENY